MTCIGRAECGGICPADRRHLAAWLRRRWPEPDRVDADLAVEGCTGWRYVVEELDRAGVRPHLAEPADTAGLRGRRRHAKTDRADSRHLRQLLADGRLPRCRIPPAHILGARALLETYRDLRVEHTAWVQRIHAVLFHHGARPLLADLGSDAGRADLAVITTTEVSAVGRCQIEVALDMLAATEAQLSGLRRDLTSTARRLRGPGCSPTGCTGSGRSPRWR